MPHFPVTCGGVWFWLSLILRNTPFKWKFHLGLFLFCDFLSALPLKRYTSNLMNNKLLPVSVHSFLCSLFFAIYSSSATYFLTFHLFSLIFLLAAISKKYHLTLACQNFPFLSFRSLLIYFMGGRPLKHIRENLKTFSLGFPQQFKIAACKT